MISVVPHTLHRISISSSGELESAREVRNKPAGFYYVNKYTVAPKKGAPDSRLTCGIGFSASKSNEAHSGSKLLAEMF